MFLCVVHKTGKKVKGHHHKEISHVVELLPIAVSILNSSTSYLHKTAVLFR